MHAAYVVQTGLFVYHNVGFDDRRYYLRVAQQPTIGCAFGRDHLSRLAVQPPLIIQIRVTDTNDREVDFEDELPFLICGLSLVTEDGEPADTVNLPSTSSMAAAARLSTGSMLDRVTAVTSARQARVTSAGSSSGATRSITTPLSTLYGTLVASPIQLPNQQRQPRTFFVFPEVSVRSCGRFRLHATVMRLALPSAAQVSSSDADLRGARLASITTDAFNVVTNAQYVAPHITELTRHFALNGVGLLLPPGQTSNE